MPQLDQHASDVVPSPLPKPDLRLLDNPIWNALTTQQREFALGAGLARRFPATIGPLSGLIEQTDVAYDDLRSLTDPDGVAALFLEALSQPRPGWSLVRGGLMSQMIWSGERPPSTAPLSAKTLLRRLNLDDVSPMVELAHQTEPGPFGVRTHELGNFFGIFEVGRLMAMAGQRLHLPGFTEVSAVCTHPDARGRGYARALMSEVMNDILSRGEMPFLHVFADNHSAIRVYESLGFTRRRTLHLAVLKSV
jgi:GNAT superfamily N-acetyltransferase